MLPPGAAACERVTSLFGAFRDGALPELLRTGIARHLDACATCRLRADDYREVIRLAGSLPPITPPPAVAARLLATIRAAAARPATGELDDTRPDILIP
ncbi:MAG: zf-HC2 domain-containing protein [Gemmataceae bacterium]